MTLTVSNNSGGISIGGMYTVQVVNGVATFTGLTLNKAGVYTLQATSGGLTPAVTNAITVMPAAASQLVVISQPPPLVTVGTGIAFVVAAEDSYGNLDPTFKGNVTVSLAFNPIGVKLGGTLSATASNGLAVLTGPTLNRVGGYMLTATNPTLTAASTDEFNVFPSSYKGLIHAGNNQSATVGSTFSSALQVAVTGSTGKPAANVPVTFTIVAGSAGATFQSTGSAAPVMVFTNASGIATTSKLAANTTAGSYSVSVAIQGIVVANFIETNKPGAAATINITAGANQTATVGAKFAQVFQVTVMDQYGNLVPNVSVTFTAPTSGAGGTFLVANSPTHTLVKTNAAGLATAPVFKANKVAGSYSVKASISTVIAKTFGETNED